MLIMTEDLEDYGPAMRKCSEKERAFVLALLEQGDMNYTRAALAAGYSGNERSLSVQGSRVAKRQRVQEAIVEEAQGRLGGAALTAVSNLARAAADPNAKDHVKACLAIMNRTGLHEVKETVVHHKHELSYKELLGELREMSTRLDIPLPAWASDAIEGEFREVPQNEAQLRLTAQSQTGREGLEDIL